MSPRPRLVWSLALAACASSPRPPPAAPPPVVATVVAAPPPAPAEPPLPPPYAPPPLPVEQLQPVRELALPDNARHHDTRVIPLADGDFALSAPGWLARFDRTGARRWERTHAVFGAELRQAGHNATLVGDAFVQQERGEVAAYDARTGALRWRRPLPRVSASWAHDEHDAPLWPMLAAVTGDDATVLLRVRWAQCFNTLDECDDPTVDRTLVLSARDGTPRSPHAYDNAADAHPPAPAWWTEPFIAIPSRHAIASQALDGVSVFDLATGAMRWHLRGDFTPHAVLGDRLLVERFRRVDPANANSELARSAVAFDLDTGAERGAWPLRADAVQWEQVDDRTAFVRWQHDGHAGVDEVDPTTGAVRARTPLAAPPAGDLRVEGDVFASPEAAYDRRDGRLRWRWWGLSALVPIDGGRAYVGVSLSHRITLFARRPQPPPPLEDVTITGRAAGWSADEECDPCPRVPEGLTVAPDGALRATLRARGEVLVHVNDDWQDAVVRLRGVGHYEGELRRVVTVLHPIRPRPLFPEADQW